MDALIAWVEAAKVRTESYFQQALMSEDIGRLRLLEAQLHAAPSRDAFRKAALYAGWSKDDMRTHELLPRLEPLIEALWQHREGSMSGDDVIGAWLAFQDLRFERLVGCLARNPHPTS